MTAEGGVERREEKEREAERHKTHKGLLGGCCKLM